jgi:hypothetical protein
MHNVIMRQIAVTAQYQPLASQPLVGSVTISAPPSNAQNVLFLGDDGSDVPWVPGEWHDFQRVDLSKIRVKGTAGDTITIIGGTW